MCKGTWPDGIHRPRLALGPAGSTVHAWGLPECFRWTIGLPWPRDRICCSERVKMILVAEP